MLATFREELNHIIFYLIDMKHTTLKNAVRFVSLSLFSAFAAIFLFNKINPQESQLVVQESQPIKHYASMPVSPAVNTDFTMAAEKAVDAVVHVTVIVEREASPYGGSFMDFFFGEGGQPRTYESMGSGSGVILTQDGYIVTNNHVIDQSKKIKVVLNDNRSYAAELVGTDPQTDIALIKLLDTGDEVFPTLSFGNSEALKIGEWVLAVGNPFSLSTTVTAGIVSAKSRNMYNMRGPNSQGKMSIESFIQTDAAVNPGNSGGALVNTSGELIGINTAIASPTGTYAGYAFAVPSTIVKKVVSDLMEYGEIKRAYLGVTINDIDKQLAEDKGLNTLRGVYVNGLSELGAAKDAGIKIGDVFIGVNGASVGSMSELQEQVSRYRPGDVISVKVLRGKSEKTFKLTLRDEYGNAEVIKNSSLASLGIELKSVDDGIKQSLGIKSGVQVIKLNNGRLQSKGMKVGYIITKINNQMVDTAEDVVKMVENVEGGLFITGVYPNGTVAYYAISMDN